MQIHPRSQAAGAGVSLPVHNSAHSAVHQSHARKHIGFASTEEVQSSAQILVYGEFIVHTYDRDKQKIYEYYRDKQCRTQEHLLSGQPEDVSSAYAHKA